MKNLSIAAAALMALTPMTADAATFVLHAGTHDAFNGEEIAYDALLTTDDAVSTNDGDYYEITGATGTATYSGLTATIAGVFGNFTLNAGNLVSMNGNFMLDGYFGFGSIQKGDLFNFIAVSEVGGPLETLTITPQVDSAVPEPATWAFLMLGFGGIGVALRRRPAVRARVRFA
ncbi:PEPxxWA-CTERM sorting domain-containing protein [Sphingomonas sp.]|uniref:PEPxxWA-CTERM sorting domain-containing protein n=1 Tax=Sphingomonas sp. TaxID=28214 RepID=UPI0025F86A14|nr:PEPxxWA-CTERM sorting domain-containing protein [Sphingomonas sp.]